MAQDESAAEIGMVSSTPDLLRRAAEELGRLHRQVPPGRWAARGLLASRPEIVAEDAEGNTEHVAEARQRSVGWIVALGPASALPLIRWLSETADALEQPGLATPIATDAATAFAAGLLGRVGARP